MSKPEVLLGRDPAHDVTEFLAGIEHIPTLPAVAIQATDELASGQPDLDRVAELVALDPGLAGMVVRCANSVYFGGGRAVTTIQDAIIRLGEKETRNAVLTAAVITAVPPLPPPLQLRSFWSLSLGSAAIARMLGREDGCKAPETAYLAGLVHLIGEALISVFFPRRFLSAWERTQDGELRLEVTLEEEFGLSHPQLCAEILRRWSFPLEVVEAVRHQLAPAEAGEARPLAEAIGTAEWICRACGLGEAGASPNTASLEAAGPPAGVEDTLHRLGYEDVSEYQERHSSLIEEAINLALTTFSGAAAAR